MNAQSSGVKVAVTVWENRVSPVFDAAQTLLIAEINTFAIGNTHYRRFRPEYIFQLIELLAEEGVMVLICGAVSREPAELLEAAGIELVPFISGDIGEVLERMADEEPEFHDLVMPGCGNHACCLTRKSGCRQNSKAAGGGRRGRRKR